MNNPTLPGVLTPVINDLLANNARPLLVGGAIRDHLLGKAPKDLDIEIYNVEPERLVTLLSKHGRVDQVGVSFGVIKLKLGNQEFDFSLPRRESKAGQGHKGFIVKPDPTMTVEEACSRRDFTINAMAFDLRENTLLDFFKGQSDLLTKTLRHTSPAFAEDPLRVMRGFQFAGRFGMVVDSKTAEFCANLKTEFPTLAKERIWGEWEKWALKSTVPAAGLKFLNETGWDECFGLDITTELKKAVNWARLVALYDNDPGQQGDMILNLVGTLCMFFKSEVEVQNFLLNVLGAPNVYQKKIGAIFRSKDVPAIDKITKTFVRRLSVALEPSNIVEASTVLKAQNMEKAGNVLVVEDVAGAEGVLHERPKPILTGKLLIERGMTPGPEMGKIIKNVYESQLDGTVTNLEEALNIAKVS